MGREKRMESSDDFLCIRSNSSQVASVEGDIQAILRERGWRCTFGTFDEDVGNRAASHHAVGLLGFCDWPAELEQISASKVLARADEWIALVPEGGMGSAALRRFVGQFCFDYHTLPVAPFCLLPMLGHARGMAAVRRFQTLDPGSGLQREPVDPNQPKIVGRSGAMERLQKVIRRVARSEAPILISGETGTGKELAARAIHSASARKTGPLVPVDCGVIPQDLIYSELFGHERGAFTGAGERRLGQVERANGGTLFLDEIGELPLSQQVHLLRLLQEGRMRRLGADHEQAVDVRIVAASHVDLAKAVKEGQFREDLYYRLNVVPLHVPPLRERIEDIQPLAEYFLAQLCKEPACRFRGFGQDALAAMASHAWPGNVRELENRIQRAAIMCEGNTIHAGDLGLVSRGGAAPKTLAEVRAEAEIKAIRDALDWACGSRTLTAQALGVSRVTLYRLMQRHNLVGFQGATEAAWLLPFKPRPEELREDMPLTGEQSRSH